MWYSVVLVINILFVSKVRQIVSFKTRLLFVLCWIGWKIKAIKKKKIWKLKLKRNKSKRKQIVYIN